VHDFDFSIVGANNSDHLVARLRFDFNTLAFDRNSQRLTLKMDGNVLFLVIRHLASTLFAGTESAS
jgi:hypothetical protein